MTWEIEFNTQGITNENIKLKLKEASQRILDSSGIRYYSPKTIEMVMEEMKHPDFSLFEKWKETLENAVGFKVYKRYPRKLKKKLKKLGLWNFAYMNLVSIKR